MDMNLNFGITENAKLLHSVAIVNLDTKQVDIALTPMPTTNETEPLQKLSGKEAVGHMRFEDWTMTFTPGTQPSKPSHPSKGKPLYAEVSHLENGATLRKARVSGDIKLELTLRKNGQLADLGGLVKDLTIAYFGMEYEAEMEALFPDTDANAA